MIDSRLINTIWDIFPPSLPQSTEQDTEQNENPGQSKGLFKIEGALARNLAFRAVFGSPRIPPSVALGVLPNASR